MDKRRGGCAPNIAYTLALLGERPLLMATAGEDFGEYRAWLEAAGVDTSLVEADRRQVQRVVLLQHRRRTTTRSRRSTPARWPTPGELSFRTVARLRAGDHLAERSRRDGPVRRGMPHARHPVHLRSGPAVRADVRRRAARRRHRRDDRHRATTTSSSCCGRRPGSSEDDILVESERADRHARRARIVGDHAGRARRRRRGHAAPDRRSDRRRRRVPRRFDEGARARAAVRRSAAQLGSVAATYALEHLGGQSHAYTWDEFKRRYQEHFGAARRCRRSAGRRDPERVALHPSGRRSLGGRWSELRRRRRDVADRSQVDLPGSKRRDRLR